MNLDVQSSWQPQHFVNRSWQVTALCEPRCAEFVAGTALCEPRCAEFVAGTALCEPRCAECVAGTALCEPRHVEFATQASSGHCGQLTHSLIHYLIVFSDVCSPWSSAFSFALITPILTLIHKHSSFLTQACIHCHTLTHPHSLTDLCPLSLLTLTTSTLTVTLSLSRALTTLTLILTHAHIHSLTFSRAAWSGDCALRCVFLHFCRPLKL